MPKERYNNSDPSVTEILDLLAKDWIVYWIKSKGLEFTEEVSSKSRKIGHKIHLSIQRYIQKKKLPPLSNHEQLMFNRIKEEILDKYEFLPTAIEKRLHSEKYHFNGTPDYIGLFDKRLALIDWKTDSDPKTKEQSRQRLVKYFLQAAGYALLIKETSFEEIKNIKFIRISKQGNVSIFNLENVNHWYGHFLWLRRLFKDMYGK